MAGVGAGDRVAEVAFDPGEGGVPQPVGADLLDGYPGQVCAEALPQVVVAAGGDRLVRSLRADSVRTASMYGRQP